jgi:signal transduction histidine kinase/CheY-like chemotaxis protein
MATSRFTTFGFLLVVLTTASPHLAHSKTYLNIDEAHQSLHAQWSVQESQIIDAEDLDELVPPRKGYRSIIPPPEAFADFGGAYWFRISLTNPTSGSIERLLEVNNSHIRRAKMWVFHDDKIIATELDGLAIERSSRPFPTGNPTFAVPFPAAAEIEIYIYAHSLDSMRWETVLWDQQAYAKHTANSRLVLGIMLGVIFVMAIYNLLIAFITKQSSFLLLGLFLSSLLCLQIVTRDLGSMYLYPNLPSLNPHLLGPAVMLFCLSTLAFSFDFLGVKEGGWYYRMNQFAKYFTALAIIPVAYFADGLTIFATALVYVLPLVATLAHAIKLSITGSVLARQYLLAFSPLAIAIAAIIGNRTLTWGWSIELNQLLLLIACASVSIALAIALAYRIRVLTKDQQVAEHAAIVAKFQAREAGVRVEAAKQESQTKSAFLATMSHEIRTPMNGVLGMAELLKQTPLDQQQQQYIDTLHRSGHALMSILNDVLDFSKVEAGKLDLEYMPVDIEELIDDITLLFRENLNRKALGFHACIHPDVPQQFNIDPTRLKQIIANLVSNAIKFCEEGAITLSVDLVPHPHQPVQQLRICVADEGIGIDANALVNLFDRFKQADSSISRRYGGTGLGLAICEKLSHLMGGEIYATSEVGRGTEITFTADIREAGLTPVAAKARQQLPGSLALFGDAEPIATALRYFCARHDIEFSTCSSIDQARQVEGPIITLVNHAELSACTNTICMGEDLKRPLVYAELTQLLVAQIEQRFQPKRIMPPDQPLTGLSVLVAEDNNINQIVVGKMLELWGATVTLADNGVEALAKLEDMAHNKGVDVVLMDCEMPKMDGYAATRNIRGSNSAYSDIPIIAVTAHALAEFRDLAKDAGMTDYVTKPIDRALLLDAITRCLPPLTA